MFCDIKDQIDNQNVWDILAACVWDNSDEGREYTVKEYKRHKTWQLYGWLDDNKIAGVCGFEVHSDRVEILHIAVDSNIRNRGIGGKIIKALRETYKMPLEAETDDDAVNFYRKCGFETRALRKYDVRRWLCVLQM